MSNPMEQMLVSVMSKLTGLTQDEMKALATQGLELVKSLDNRLEQIELTLKEFQTQTSNVELGIDDLETALKEVRDELTMAKVKATDDGK